MAKFSDNDLAIQLLQDNYPELAKIMLKSNVQKIMNTGAISATKIAEHLGIEPGSAILVTFDEIGVEGLKTPVVHIRVPNDEILKAKERLGDGL